MNVVNYEVTPVRRLLSNIVLDFEVLSHDELISPQDFLRDISEPVVRFISEKKRSQVLFSPCLRNGED